MYKDVGVRFADFISFFLTFLKYPVKMKYLGLTMIPNNFILIWYLKTGGGGGEEEVGSSIEPRVNPPLTFGGSILCILGSLLKVKLQNGNIF